MNKLRVLIVDDEKDVSRVMAINLQLEGLDVIEIHDGLSAIDSVEEFKPDCIVLDVMLPKVNGWDVLKFIKNNPATAGIPVIMVTAKVLEKDQLHGLGAGAARYITKPFSPAVLTEAVKSVLESQEREEVARKRRETIEHLQLSLIHKISDILISTSALDDLLERVADKLANLFDLSLCGLLLSDNDESEMYVFHKALHQWDRGKNVSRNVVSRRDAEKLKGVFAANRLPVRISDLEEFNLNMIFLGMSAMEEGYAFPLFEHDKYLGAVIVADKSSVDLSPDEVSLLATITNQVAVAVARARLHENLREEEVIHKRLLHQTITAQETERRRLASEMHDSVVQSLVGMSYKLQVIEKKIALETYDELQIDLKALGEQLNTSIKELRDLLLGLRPPMLDDMGLLKALDVYLKSFGIKNDIQCVFQEPDDMPQLNKDAQINLFRIAQEALNNIEKHARASRVTVEIEVLESELHLMIRDDGRGFTISKTQHNPRKLGIASMRERTELLGGRLSVKSEVDHGTVVKIDVPLKQIVEE